MRCAANSTRCTTDPRIAKKRNPTWLIALKRRGTDPLPVSIPEDPSGLLAHLEQKITLPATLGEGEQWYLKAMLHHELLSQEEEYVLACLTKQKGEYARRAWVLLMAANQRLVHHIARRHYQSCGMNLEDLLQEGNIGLWHAIFHFDPRRGRRLSSYATPAIRRWMGRAVMNQGTCIRIPIHRYAELMTFKATRDTLRQARQEEPTDEELAAAMHVSLEQVEDYWMWLRSPRSLDETVGASEDDLDLSDSLSDEAVQVEDASVETVFAEQVHTVIRRVLNPRQAYVVLARTEKTLEQIAQELHVSREDIRVIQRRALKKLRAHPEMQALWEACS